MTFVVRLWHDLGFRIGTQIHIGFSVIVLCLVVAASMAGIGLYETQQDAKDFGTINERMSTILTLNREVVELQRNIQVFSYTGHVSIARRARAEIAGIRTRLEIAKNLLSEERQDELVQRMTQHLNTYEETFESAVEERSLRYELVHHRLPRLNVELVKKLETARKSTKIDHLHSRIQSALVQTRANVYHYVTDPDYRLFEETAILSSQVIAEAYAQGGAYAEIALAFEQYQKTFSRIVQATRSYLYLVGVVMAGEAMELGHVTWTLRENTMAQTPRIIAEIHDAAEQALVRTSITALIAVLLGAILTGLLTRNISGKVTEISETFEQLARGEQVTNIPGTERRDEIGTLASAANAFRQQNERTAHLLEQAQSLTVVIETSKRELERSNDELEQFVYTVSHDLKSPIVTCNGYIGMMKELAAKGLHAEALAKLDVLERSNKKMSQLTTDLLELSRVGRADIDIASLDPKQILDEVMDTLSQQISDTRAHIVVHDPLPTVMANRTRLTQVFENLVGNALKYGGFHDHPAEIEIGGKVGETGEVCFFVRDHGPGIAPEYHERVFMLFERLRNDNNGTGVGLSIVSKVMKFHGGTVHIESCGKNDGCTFWLRFPQTKTLEVAA